MKIIVFAPSQSRLTARLREFKQAVATLPPALLVQHTKGMPPRQQSPGQSEPVESIMVLQTRVAIYRR